jgi:hypothetical protein
MFLYKCIVSFKYNYLINQSFTNSISILALWINGLLLHFIQHIFLAIRKSSLDGSFGNERYYCLFS